eukprot:TRINITY_DN2810_c0_g1_i7.p1 TRINITY_DN2810_c0_g1~~TRINITY_DN2810_c0_g1_i7.p1  ORF type:complete len:1576 (-),score=447.66 TRINITY_DN2810_c0_g1_i7:152-4210(-)
MYWFGQIWRDAVVGVIEDFAHARKHIEGATRIASLLIRAVPPLESRHSEMELKGTQVIYSFDLKSKYEVKNSQIYYWVRETMEKVGMDEPVVAENLQELLSLHPSFEKYIRVHCSRPNIDYVRRFIENVETNQQKVREYSPSFLFMINFAEIQEAANSGSTSFESWLSYVNDHVGNYAHALVQLASDDGMSPLIAGPAREIIKKGGIKGLYINVAEGDSAKIEYQEKEGLFILSEAKSNPYSGYSNFYTDVRRYLHAPAGTFIKGIDISGFTLAEIYDGVDASQLERALSNFEGKVEVDMDSIKKQAQETGLAKEDEMYWFGQIWRDAVVGVIEDIAHARKSIEGASKLYNSLLIRAVPPLGSTHNQMGLKGTQIIYSFDLKSKYEVKNSQIYYWVKEAVENPAKVEVGEPKPQAIPAAPTPVAVQVKVASPSVTPPSVPPVTAFKSKAVDNPTSTPVPVIPPKPTPTPVKAAPPPVPVRAPVVVQPTVSPAVKSSVTPIQNQLGNLSLGPGMDKYVKAHNNRPNLPCVTEFMKNLEEKQKKLRESYPGFVFLVDFPGLQEASKAGSTSLEHWLSYVNDHIGDYTHGLTQLVLDNGMGPLIAAAAREIVKQGGIKGLVVEVVDSNDSKMEYLQKEGFFMVQELKDNPYNGFRNFYTDVRRHLYAPAGISVTGISIDFGGLDLYQLGEISTSNLQDMINRFGGKVEVDMPSIMKRAKETGTIQEDPMYWFGYVWRDAIISLIEDVSNAKQNVEGAAPFIQSISIKAGPIKGEEGKYAEMKGTQLNYTFDTKQKYGMRFENVYYWVGDNIGKGDEKPLPPLNLTPDQDPLQAFASRDSSRSGWSVGDQKAISEFYSKLEKGVKDIRTKNNAPNFKILVDWNSFVGYETHSRKGSEVCEYLKREVIDKMMWPFSNGIQEDSDLAKSVLKSQFGESIRGIVVVAKKLTTKGFPVVKLSKGKNTCSTENTQYEYNEKHKVVFMYKNLDCLQESYDDEFWLLSRHLLKVHAPKPNEVREDKNFGWNLEGFSLLQTKNIIERAKTQTFKDFTNAFKKEGMTLTIDWISFLKLADPKSQVVNENKLGYPIIDKLCIGTLREWIGFFSQPDCTDFQPPEVALIKSELNSVHIQCTPREIATKFHGHRPFFEDAGSVEYCDNFRLQHDKVAKKWIIHIMPEKLDRLNEGDVMGENEYPTFYFVTKMIWGLFWASEKERDDSWEQSKMCWSHVLNPKPRSLTYDASIDRYKILTSGAPSLPRKTPVAQSGKVDPSVVPPPPPEDDDEEVDDDDDDYGSYSGGSSSGKSQKAEKPAKPAFRKCPHCGGKGVSTCVCGTPKHCKQCGGSKKITCRPCKGSGQLKN